LKCKPTFEKGGAKLKKIFFTNNARRGGVRGLLCCRRSLFLYCKRGFALAPPLKKVDIK